MFEDIKKRIEDEIAEDLRNHDLEIIDLSLHHRNRTVAIQLLLDHEDGGITLAECAYFNKKINMLIENETLLGGEYTVEVSSPGLDRPLRTERDFMRVRGKKVKFHLKQMIENKLEHDGSVQAVDHDTVTIATTLKSITIPLGLIQKAVQIINDGATYERAKRVPRPRSGSFEGS